MSDPVFLRSRTAIGRLAAVLLCVSLTAGLVGRVEAQAGPAFVIAKRDADAVEALCEKIIALSPKVWPGEARRVAECAYGSAYQLTHDYGVFGPPLFHNFLVNTGIRKRGLCFQWAEDLLAQLDRLQLTTLELHWGEARAGSWREHNCVVVTAKGHPFRTGIILDCWRHSGHLYWAALASDHYPWIENSDYARTARAKSATAPKHQVASQSQAGDTAALSHLSLGSVSSHALKSTN